MKLDFSPFKGKFVTFEGIEGVGKTTNLKFMAECLRTAGLDVVVTREPGGTEVGEEIRQILLRHRVDLVYSDTEMLLLFAARAQHIKEVIRPALLAGSCVLCDRFTDATYAYQGGGRGIDDERIFQLEKLVQADLSPDMVFLFDLPVSISLERARGRAQTDRIEEEEKSFFERARKAYLGRAKMNPDKYKLIDATKPLAEVQQNILDILHNSIVLA